MLVRCLLLICLAVCVSASWTFDPDHLESVLNNKELFKEKLDHAFKMDEMIYGTSNSNTASGPALTPHRGHYGATGDDALDRKILDIKHLVGQNVALARQIKASHSYSPAVGRLLDESTLKAMAPEESYENHTQATNTHSRVQTMNNHLTTLLNTNSAEWRPTLARMRKNEWRQKTLVKGKAGASSSSGQH